MTRTRILTALTALATLAPAASAQTVDDIIAKHVAARGGLEKLKAVKTMRMTGTMAVGPGIEAPFTLETKRPNLMRVEFTLQGQTGVQAFDGKTAWMVMPFMGKKDPEAMPAEETKTIEEQADFDGPLVDYAAKGHTVELVGKETVEGAEAYKLKVTLKNGDVRYIYIDTEYHLEIRAEGTRTMRGTPIDFESSTGDYKEVDGMMFPHAIESGAKGMPQRQKMTIAKIELNPAIDDARFAMPAPAAPAPATPAATPPPPPGR
jgi:outer membrane lipoprotein-sorting protein